MARLCSMSGVQRLIQCDALLLRWKLVTAKASRLGQVGGSVLRSPFSVPKFGHGPWRVGVDRQMQDRPRVILMRTQLRCYGGGIAETRCPLSLFPHHDARRILISLGAPLQVRAHLDFSNGANLLSCSTRQLVSLKTIQAKARHWRLPGRRWKWAPV